MLILWTWFQERRYFQILLRFSSNPSNVVGKDLLRRNRPQLRFNNETLTNETPVIQSLLFGKETVKTFLFKSSNPGINESTPQTQSNVSWISSKGELEISLLKSCRWKKAPKMWSKNWFCYRMWSVCEIFWFLVFGLLYRHTTDPFITSGTHTSGAQ